MNFLFTPSLKNYWFVLYKQIKAFSKTYYLDNSFSKLEWISVNKLQVDSSLRSYQVSITICLRGKNI